MYVQEAGEGSINSREFPLDRWRESATRAFVLSSFFGRLLFSALEIVGVRALLAPPQPSAIFIGFLGCIILGLRAESYKTRLWKFKPILADA